MIIEQIRYFIDEANREQVVHMRREVDRIRHQFGLPTGYIFLADPSPETGPNLIWQCGYGDEGEMGMAEATLIGNAEYEAARAQLSDLVVRAELELYTADNDVEG